MVRVALCKSLARRVDVVLGKGLFLVPESGFENMSPHSKLIALATKNQVATVHDCDPWTKSITTQIGLT